MSYSESLRVVTLVSGEDFTGDQYKFVTLNGSGQAVLVSGAGDPVFGILCEEVDAIGKSIPVALLDGGVSKVVANAAITVGQVISVDTTTARAVGNANLSALGANEQAVGIALEAAGAAGEIIAISTARIASGNA